TLLADLGSTPADALPALVETATPGAPSSARHPFRTTRLKIGRPGLGNDIEIRDLADKLISEQDDDGKH
ncbi:MAG: hypothetical protein ACKOWG_05775, partial [Planctomycetia bacterium]